MSLSIAKQIPNDATRVIDILPHTDSVSGASYFRINSSDSFDLYLEDLRSYMAELTLNIDGMTELVRALQKPQTIRHSPITVRNRRIMLGHNSVTLMREVSDYIDASVFVPDFNQLEKFVNTGINVTDLGPCYLIMNGDFVVLLDKDFQNVHLVYVSTLMSALTNIQSVHKSNVLELNIFRFMVSSNLHVQDSTVVHMNDSVIINCKGFMQVARTEVLNLALANLEKSISRISVMEAFQQLGIVRDYRNHFVEVYFNQGKLGGDRETGVTFVPVSGSKVPQLEFLIDCSVSEGTEKGFLSHKFIPYLDRNHEHTSTGRGDPPSLLKDFRSTVRLASQGESLRRSKLFNV